MKLFDSELIDEIINEMKNNEDQEEIIEEIKDKVLKFQEQGKSKQKIISLLFGIIDKGLLFKIIDNLYDSNLEKETIKLLVIELKERNFDNEKIIKKMLSKGFNYYQIKEVL